MPTYAYRCLTCGHKFDQYRPADDAGVLPPCERCARDTQRIFDLQIPRPRGLRVRRTVSPRDEAPAPSPALPANRAVMVDCEMRNSEYGVYMQNGGAVEIRGGRFVGNRKAIENRGGFVYADGVEIS